MVPESAAIGRATPVELPTGRRALVPVPACRLLSRSYYTASTTNNTLKPRNLHLACGTFLQSNISLFPLIGHFVPTGLFSPWRIVPSIHTEEYHDA